MTGIVRWEWAFVLCCLWYCSITTIMYYSVDKIQPTAGDNSATTKAVRDGKYLTEWQLQSKLKVPQKQYSKETKLLSEMYVPSCKDIYTEQLFHYIQ